MGAPTSDRATICSDQHDTSGYKLLLLLVFGNSSPTKDGGNGLGGVLVGWGLVLALFSTLTVFSLIIIMPWLLQGFATERCLQASALS